MKKCTKCGIEKDVSYFYKKGKNRLRSECKDCFKSLAKKWYYEQDGKKAKQTYNRNWYYKNGGQEKNAVTHKKWYYENGGREITSKRHRENRINNPNIDLLRGARKRAKEKNIPFDITAEDITIPETCPVLGIQLQIGEKVVCNNSPTLDRIKPELGYVKGNIQVMSFRANMLKNNATVEELQKVLEHLKKMV
jgi:hypothetical protein